MGSLLERPIIGMLDDIRIKVMNRLRENDEFVSKWYGLVSPNTMKLYNEYLKIAQVCKVNGNGDSRYEVTERHDRHVVNLRQKRCTCRTWDLTGIPCPHAIKAMIHKKIDPISEIHWYHSKEAFKLAYKHKLQPVKGIQFWNVDPSQAMEPPALVKLAGRPTIKRDRGKDEALKRQGEWKLSRKGRVMTCNNCGEPNHNVRGCGKPKKGKQQVKKRHPARGKKRKTRSLVDKDENSQVEEEINLTAPQPTQDSQPMPSRSTLFPNFEYPSVEEDDEDPFLRPIVIFEFSTRRQMRQKAQEPTGRRAISFRGDDNGVSEATNLPVSLTRLT
ncbi:uncharacterized protein LOC129900070 [Solanum dulcamara]|uniref:uncharacterized protein LOC129900070 n=1 Tax=Solanum dulcamara TaxID=45834 RepID=UPI002486ADE4|nr:uncharacterized protein LOC129900070 [Solanum dulcamara]